MRKLRHVFAGAVVLLVVLWLIAEPTIFRSTTFFGLWTDQPFVDTRRP
jgi:hypothetical protein